MQKLKLNATKARKQFFNLLSLAAGGAEIVITRHDMDTDIILKRREKGSNQNEVDKNLRLFRKTYGAIKTSGYKSDEFELAKRKFVKDYQKKNDGTK